MKNNMLLSLIAVFFICSCIDLDRRKAALFANVDAITVTKNVSLKEKKEGRNISVNLKQLKPSTTLVFSEVFDTVRYIKLEDHPDILIGNIDKLLQKNDTFYVLDRYKAMKLAVFDGNGNFIRTFGQAGGGPQEQQEITDFVVTNKEVILYDQFKAKLFYFSHDGSFLSSKSVPFIFNAFAVRDENNYVFYCIDADNYHLPEILGYSILQTDSNFVVKNKNAFREKNKYENYLAHNLVSSGKSLYYKEPLNDTIFQIEKDGTLLSDFIVDFGKYKLPDKYLLEENKRERRRIVKDEYYAMFVDQFFPMDDFLYFSFSLKSTLHHVVYSYKTGKIFDGGNTLDDTFYTFPIENILTCKDNKLIGTVDCDELVDWYKRCSQDGNWVNLVKDNIFKNFMSRLDYELNPLIVIYELKNF